jgi:hypothetical protein
MVTVNSDLPSLLLVPSLSISTVSRLMMPSRAQGFGFYGYNTNCFYTEAPARRVMSLILNVARVYTYAVTSNQVYDTSSDHRISPRRPSAHADCPK